MGASRGDRHPHQHSVQVGRIRRASHKSARVVIVLCCPLLSPFVPITELPSFKQMVGVIFHKVERVRILCVSVPTEATCTAEYPQANGCEPFRRLITCPQVVPVESVRVVVNVKNFLLVITF